MIQRSVWPFLLSWLLLALTGCEEAILHDLDELQANQVRVVLAGNGIQALKKREGASWTVSVAEADVVHALAVLAGSRTVKREARNAPEGMKSLVPGREERVYVLERQVAWNLEQTLERFPGALEARVHLALDSSDGFDSRERPPSRSASVLLLTSANAAISDEKVREIVSGASGVDKGRIAVVLQRQPAAAEDASRVPAPTAPLPEESAASRGSVRNWTEAHRSALGGICALGGVILFGAWRAAKGRQEQRCPGAERPRDDPASAVLNPGDENRALA